MRWEWKQKIGIILLVMVMLLSVACGNSGSKEADSIEKSNAEKGEITVTDMLGREISLEKPAERVVALTPGDCEILFAIDAGNIIVGRGEFCDYPESLQNVTTVESGANTNTEQIIALKPDVIILSDMAQTPEQISALERAKMKVIVTSAQDIEGVYEAASLIGKVVGKEQEAADLVASMKKDFSDIKEKAKDKEKKGEKVYFEVSPLEFGLWAAGKDTFMNEIADMIGIENIFYDVSGWAEVSEEQVIQRNPQLIVTITMYEGRGTKPEEEIMARKGWDTISAVKTGQIYNASSDELARPGPRLVDGAKQLYSAFYGEEL